MSEDRAIRARVVLAYLAFVLIGSADGALGVLLPSIQRFYGLDNATVSWLFLFSTAGYLISAFSSGLLVARLGTRAVITLGVGAFLVGAIPIRLSRSEE